MEGPNQYRAIRHVLRLKTFEEQIHGNWIDRGDAQYVTDHAVCRRSAALHQAELREFGVVYITVSSAL
jgi:hypothetical protein